MKRNLWEKVGSYEWLDAEMIKGFLEGEGISVRIIGERLGSIYGITKGPLGMKSILVPSEHVQEAKEILVDLEKLKSNTGSDNLL